MVEIKWGIDEILFEDILIEKLKLGKLLIIKVGFDLIVLDLYLGYMVLINKMCVF